MGLRVREVTAEERVKLERVVRAKSLLVRPVQRAWMTRFSTDGVVVPTNAREAGPKELRAHHWITRFVTNGFVGLENAP